MKRPIISLLFVFAINAAGLVRANSLLPDGTPFPFWQDETSYTIVYHVNNRHAKASDENPGTEELPWRTINHAAQILQAGQKVIIHGGVYRERVDPACGGETPARMIAYEAAKGEQVVVKGSVEWKGPITESDYFHFARLPSHRPVYKIQLPAGVFSGANPFALQNYPRDRAEAVAVQAGNGTSQALPGMEMRRGQVFFDGTAVRQVSGDGGQALNDLMLPEGAFWVEDNGMTIHFTAPAERKPEDLAIELTVHEQVFAPSKRHLNYIRVSGLSLEHAGNGIPIPTPQKGLLSSNAGHHWIISDCTIQHANTIGADLGGGYWNYPVGDFQGGHIVRRCVFRHCGLSALQAWHNRPNEFLLVEDCLFEQNAFLPVERRYESAGVKLHGLQNSLIRRNVIRDSGFTASLWLDGEIFNTRVTQNVLGNLGGGASVLGGHVFIEVSLGPCLIDNNVMIGSERNGFYEHDSERCVVVQNLIAKCAGSAVHTHMTDPGRRVMPWDRPNPPLENEHRMLGNILMDSTRLVVFRNKSSWSDDNVFGGKADAALFTDIAASWVEKAGGAPEYVDFATWQAGGQDVHSVISPLTMNFEPKAMELRFFGSGLSKLPERAYETLRQPTFTKPEKWRVIRPKDGSVVLDQDQPAPVLAPLADLLTKDLLGIARSRTGLKAGPLENLPLDGSPLAIDPRQLKEN